MTPHAHPHAPAHAEHFDAHGHKDHGHVIVSVATLRTVLLLLLFFTLLTVGAAKAEVFISQTFNVEIPQAINVFVALSIAAVKTVIVVMFFMQLKYDNPLNTMIMVFTFLTVGFFMGFTVLDLGNRGTLDPFKQQYIIPGGTGLKHTDNKTITQWAEDAAKSNGTYDPHHAHHRHDARLSITDMGYVPDGPLHGGSSAQRSRPITVSTGLVPGTAPGAPGAATDEAAHGEGPAH